jgi:four helix bundle protein
MTKTQNLSTEGQKSKQYDLEERTLQFAKQVFVFVNKLPKTLTTIEISKQVVRSAGSVGANYIEANEAVSRKDFVLRIKICRKEAKETRY